MAANSPAVVQNKPAVQVDQFSSVRGLLEKSKDQIARALPKHLSADRLLRIATTELSKNAELLACDPISFIGAIIQCSQLGLEPGSGLGHAYLVPFYNSKKGIKEVQFIPGYRGLIDLARRSGQIVSISARVVYENDEFSFEYGFDEKLIHKPTFDDPGELVAVYAVAKLKDGGTQFEVMSRRQVEKTRDGGAGKNNPVWKNHFDEMARKTVIRRLFKYLPVSVEMAQAAEQIDREESGISQDNSQPLIDVGVQPVPSETAKTIQQIDAEAKNSKDEEQRQAMLNKVENKISARMQGGQSPTDIEQLVGMSIDAINDLTTERLLVVWEKLK